MPSNPPTVADLAGEVGGRCAVPLAEAGVYFRATDGEGSPITPFILQGLRMGAKCVGLFLSNPLVLTDADAARLSPYALERVLDEAEYFALTMALLVWHRALQKYAEAAVAPVPSSGGWLYEEKRNVRERLAQLKLILSEPYREPADPAVALNSPESGFGGASSFYPGDDRGFDCPGPY